MIELPPLHAPISAPGLLDLGQIWVIEGPDAERIRFREVRPGAAFTVRDAASRWFRARLHRRGAGGALVGEVFEAMAPAESPLSLVLLQALPARERMLWIAQKATEMGAHWIQPIFTARSLGSGDLEREKAHRWPAAIRRAVAQCRRGAVPVLLPPCPLAEAVAGSAWRAAGVKWALVEGRPEGARRQGNEGARERLVSAAALLVGPEGGWTPEEVAILRAAGGAAVSLGARILRAETAALVGLTLLQREYGDLRP